MKCFLVIRVIIIIMAFFLSGCQAIPADEDSAKKVTAAKINDQLGMAYLERRDYQRAKQKFLTALELAPTIPEAWYSMAYFLETTGNKENANEYYAKAVILAPHRGDVLNNFGTFLCRSGEYQQAISYFMKATKDKEYLDIAGAYENAGLCALKLPKNSDSKAYFIKALNEDPKRTTSLIELAEIYYKQGNYKESRNMLDHFLKLTKPTVQSFRLEKKLETS